MESLQIHRRCIVSLLTLVLAGAAAVPGTGPAVIPAVTPMKGTPRTAVQLFNGKDLTGWGWHPSVATLKVGDIWTVKDGVLHCAATRTTGFIDTDKEYKNFILTVEYRHLTNANGGVFICISGEEKVWPDSIQIQGKFGNVGDLLNQNSGMKKMTTDPARTKTVNKDIIASRITPPAGQKAEKALGEWNLLVITMEYGNLSVTNNGVLLNTAAEILPASGKIGIQAEGAEMEFRKVELVPIEAP
jgi:Domain of Unknown Function (DUF1080)